MIRKWLAEQGTWIFIILVLGGFGFVLYREAPWSLEKQCVNVSPPEDWITAGRGLPPPDPEAYDRKASQKELWDKCQQLKQHQSRKKN
jgi:hypothetical protein